LATKHLTRRELKRKDHIYATISSASSVLLRQTTVVLVVLGVVAAAVLGFFLWRNYQQSQDTQAQKQFGDALEIFHGGVLSSNTPSAGQANRPLFVSEGEKYRKALEKFTQLYQQYPSRKVGALARYYVAITQHDLKNDKEAVRILQEMERSSDLQLRGLVRKALAEIYHANGMNDQAMQIYQTMLKDTESQFPKDALLAGMAETAEAMGKQSEASNYYQRLMREHAQSAYGAEARARLAVLNPTPK
jgi:tetratricopeptide (TPR) repeat protein